MPHDHNSAVEIVGERVDRRSPSPWKLPARWRIEVRGKSSVNLPFKAAIARDGHLELADTTTPYDTEFTASRLIALFEPSNGGRLSVVAYSDASGAYAKQASHEADGGSRILFDETVTSFQAGSL